MIDIFKQLFLPTRFFVIATVIIVAFTLSFIIHWLFPIAQSAILLLIIITIADCILLLGKKHILIAERDVQAIMSLGDKNKIAILLKNLSGVNLQIILYDDLPYQLQNRDFKIKSSLANNEEKLLEYFVIPKSRGEYIFGNINILITSPIGLINKKFVIEQKRWYMYIHPLYK